MGNWSNRSHARTHAQPRADLESPRARAPYMAGREFSPPTVLRADTLQSKSKRFPTAYGVAKHTAQRRAHRKPLGGISPMSCRPLQPLRKSGCPCPMQVSVLLPTRTAEHVRSLPGTGR